MKYKLFNIFLMLFILASVGCSNQETDSAENENYSWEDEEISDYTEEETEYESTEPIDEVSSDETSESVQEGSLTKTDMTEEMPNNIIDVKSICQYPELATGCEITSLTMTLNYYGFDVDKCDLSDYYLDKGPVGETDFRLAFEGDPRDGNSYGCYAPVIKNTANKYLQTQNSSMYAKDITGLEFEELFSYIDQKIPVIVWGTLDCREGHYSVTWNVDGKNLTWFTPEHCMVLVGYDNENVTVCDPTRGDIRSYDRQLFKSRYNSLQKQAVVIVES